MHLAPAPVVPVRPRRRPVGMLPRTRPLPLSGVGWIDIPSWVPGADDIDLPRIPTTPDEVIELGLPMYRQRVQKAAPWLRARGRQIGRLVVTEGTAAIRGGIPLAPEEPPNPPWLPQVVDPVMDPVIEGVMDEVGPFLGQTAWVTAAVIFGVGGVAGWLLSSMMSK